MIAILEARKKEILISREVFDGEFHENDESEPKRQAIDRNRA